MNRGIHAEPGEREFGRFGRDAITCEVEVPGAVVIL
jgi:hypothetical protein